MTRPAATITAAITTDGARDTRSRRRRALGEIAAPPLDSASSVDDSTCVSSGKLRPNGVLSPISAGAVAWSFGGTAVESPTLAVFSPHAGQNGRPATRAPPHRGQKRREWSVIDAWARSLTPVIGVAADLPVGGQWSRGNIQRSSPGLGPASRHPKRDCRVPRHGRHCLRRRRMAGRAANILDIAGIPPPGGGDAEQIRIRGPDGVYGPRTRRLARRN